MVVVAVVAAVAVCVERCGVAVVFFMCVAFVFRLFDLWKSKGLGLSSGSKTEICHPPERNTTRFFIL